MHIGMSGEGLPDTFGLPEYKVSEVLGEIIGGGHDVRLVCGAKRFGNMHWLYTVIASPPDLLLFSRQCEALAQEAFNLSQMMEGLAH